jgi:hypothetical protein
MMSLQAEASKTVYDIRDPLCLSNSSLHALQNLQPWSESNAAQGEQAATAPSGAEKKGD